MRRFMPWGLAAYLLAAIGTFGHAAAGVQAHCRDVIDCAPDFAALTGMLDGIFWPLYWAWELQA